MTKLIVICGEKRNGKDTTADYICKNYGYTKLELAYPLKKICKIAFDLDEEQLYGNSKEIIDERYGVKPREIMQFVGTDLFRNNLKQLIPNAELIWIQNIIRIIEKNPNKKYVITDARFQNDIDVFKKYGAICIKVSRKDMLNMDNHESEKNIKDIKGIDYYLQNDSTIKDLYLKIDDLFINNCW